MKDKSILISMGIILYIIMAGVDRFVYAGSDNSSL